MASDGSPGNISATRFEQGSQAKIISKLPEGGGKSLPPSGSPAAAHMAAHVNPRHAPIFNLATKAAPAQPAKLDLQPLVAQLNKYLNDSGRPNQYRVVTSSGSQVIQEINPANGAVVGEFSAIEFPALAKSLGVPGILIDSHA